MSEYLNGLAAVHDYQQQKIKRGEGPHFSFSLDIWFNGKWINIVTETSDSGEDFDEKMDALDSLEPKPNNMCWGTIGSF